MAELLSRFVCLFRFAPPPRWSFMRTGCRLVDTCGFWRLVVLVRVHVLQLGASQNHVKNCFKAIKNKRPGSTRMQNTNPKRTNLGTSHSAGCLPKNLLNSYPFPSLIPLAKAQDGPSSAHGIASYAAHRILTKGATLAVRKLWVRPWSKKIFLVALMV